MGHGERLEEILRTLGSVAEGVTTAKAAKTIIDELGVSAPIAQGVSESKRRDIREILTNIIRFTRSFTKVRFEYFVEYFLHFLFQERMYENVRSGC